eukprot:m51a1_g3841 hypothetical protein (223) ;mRNA; r:355740-356586
MSDSGEDPQAKRIATRAVALAISQACYENEKRCEVLEALSGPFGCRRGHRPSVSIEDFVADRLAKYTRASSSELIAALALLDRALSAGTVALTWRTAHRLYATALVITVKFNQDGCYKNNFYAKVVGVTNEELNALEAVLLGLVSFEAWVQPDVLSAYSVPIAALAEAIAAEEARRARAAVATTPDVCSEQEKAAKRRKIVAGSPLAQASSPATSVQLATIA